MTNKGFTLAEMLVVMAITAIVGTILVIIFTNTLRGSNKAQILAVIKQNGQGVLENMDKTIRNADSVICPTGDTSVIVKNGLYARFRFIAPTSSANGMLQQDNPVAGSDIKLFIDNVCTEPLVNPVNTLTDTNAQSGVSVTGGSFTRSQQSGFKDVVTISFTLGPGVNAPPVITSQIDPVTFQTTIGLR